MPRPYVRVSISGWQFKYEFPFRFTRTDLRPTTGQSFASVQPPPELQEAPAPETNAQPLPPPLPPPPIRDGNFPDIFLWGIIDWKFRFQRPQHLALGLGRIGHRVFYISSDLIPAERPGFTVEPISDRVSLIHLHAWQPLSIYNTRLSASGRAAILQSVGKLARWVSPHSAFSLVEHPFWHPFAAALPNSRLVCDLLDFLPGFDNAGDHVGTMEEDLLRDADLIVTTSSVLEKYAGERNSNVAIVRNGTDYGHFADRPVEVFIDPLGRRVIGYYGAIATWFDTEIVAAIAAAFPDCLVLLIGADTTGAGTTLSQFANVRLEGEVPYSRLPYYLYAFDVAVMPFRVNALTQATNPVKVYEYLSAGKPVVATDLPELAQFDGLVRVAADTDTFIHEITNALADGGSPEEYALRRAFAATQTWRHRTAALSDALAATHRPRVSLVVVAYNQLSLTKACLASIAEESHYEDLETIVVDNASSDGTAAYLKEWQADGPGRTAIINTTNRGFAGGVNQGLSHASGAFLVIMNNDIIVTPGWVGTLVNHLRRNPDIGLIGPVTNAIGNEARIDITYANLAAMPDAARTYTSSHIGSLLPMETLAFFCVALPRRVLDAVGLLDEQFETGYFEDDDYCRRVAAAGFRAACAEDVFVHHEHSGSFQTLPKNVRDEIFRENRKRYEDKWGEWRLHTGRTDEAGSGHGWPPADA